MYFYICPPTRIRIGGIFKVPPVECPYFERSFCFTDPLSVIACLFFLGIVRGISGQVFKGCKTPRIVLCFSFVCSRACP